MATKIYSSMMWGIEAELVEVECQVFRGQLPGFSIVGLADKAVQEAKDRIISAIKNSGFEWPRKKIIINLSPAHIHKSGTGFDLPIALAILSTTSQIKLTEKSILCFGELSLDGRVRPVHGVLASLIKASRESIISAILPAESSHITSFIKDIEYLPIADLKELRESKILFKSNLQRQIKNESYCKAEVDMADIVDNEFAKRGLEIAAAGNHAILLQGTPGSGKSMLSKALQGILPSPTEDEILDILQIDSTVATASHLETLTRPYRTPHHTISLYSFIGGGINPTPGEITRAHRGVLFLDEFPEFKREVIEALRQPLEEKKLAISRLQRTVVFPCNFLLVCAMNPCKCGWYGDPARECTCTTTQVMNYKQKLSGPLLDRIDIQIHVPRIDISRIGTKKASDSSEKIRSRVQKTRDIQLSRYRHCSWLTNADIPQNKTEKYCELENDTKDFLVKATSHFALSARSYYRIIRIARTIADLEGSKTLKKHHISEALLYRLGEVV